MPEYTAVLMAGGASRRMGRPKALLDYCGEPLWKYQLRTLADLNPDKLLISGTSEVILDDPPCEVILDTEPGLGPLAGLRTVLTRVRPGFVIVLAVDMPAMTAAYLRGLMEDADPHGVIPELDGRTQGLSAIYPVEISPLVDAALATGDRSFQSLMKLAIPAGLMKTRPVPDADRGLFRNINTMEEYRSLPGLPSAPKR